MRGVTFYHRMRPLFGGLIKWSISLNLYIIILLCCYYIVFLVDPKSSSYGWKTPPITPNLFPSSPNPKRSTSLGSLPDADVNYLNSQWPKLPYQENKSHHVCSVCTCVCVCARVCACMCVGVVHVSVFVARGLTLMFYQTSWSQRTQVTAK